MNDRVAILGGGNIGRAIARGLIAAGRRKASEITITRRHEDALQELAAEGFAVDTSNAAAVGEARWVLLCVQPGQAVPLAHEIRPALNPERHVCVSVMTGVSRREIAEALGGSGVPIVRAMPNTAILLGESMTCLAGDGLPTEVLDEVTALFDHLGRTVVIDEDLMTPATALCACGVAFFLRAIRAASQGGIEIGFHAEDALTLAAQTARGAASLLLQSGTHPEREIDRVTTPRGCTIAGLNQMEHDGFSSALIRGIVTSAEKAGTLGAPPDSSPRPNHS